MAELNFKLDEIKWRPLYQWQITALVPLVMVVSLILTYVIYHNFTIGQTHHYQQLVKTEVKLKQELELKYSLIKSIPLYQSKLNELNALESVVNQQFPSSDDLPNLLIQINQLAEDAKVNVTSLMPNTAASAAIATQISGKIASKSYILTAEANYLDFTRFIYAIAGLPRVIKVENLSLTRGQENKINIFLVLTIYYSN